MNQPLRESCRELRAKDISRVQANVDELDAREKRGLTKEQKEERDHARKVLEFLKEGQDVRSVQPPTLYGRLSQLRNLFLRN